VATFPSILADFKQRAKFVAVSSELTGTKIEPDSLCNPVEARYEKLRSSASDLSVCQEHFAALQVHHLERAFLGQGSISTDEPALGSFFERGRLLNRQIPTLRALPFCGRLSTNRRNHCFFTAPSLTSRFC